MRSLAGLIAIFLFFAAPFAWAGSVGFQEVMISNGSDRPLRVGLWYPTDAAPSDQPLETFTQSVAPGGSVARGARLPLVVMSHGNGGWYGEHYDTALALAHAGFVVAAVSHTGDTYDDQSRATRMIDRPRHIHRLIDYMTAEWPDHARIDPARIGVFGFSSGGFTALVSAGATPDFSRIPAHCAAHPAYFDCQLVKSAPADVRATLDQARTQAGDAWVHDPRIRAAVAAAPALGFTFGREGLAGVHVPVQLWRDVDDHILPNPDYAQAVADSLPTPPDYRLVEHADHFDFLAPCSAVLKAHVPMICQSEPGFDRAAFHADFDARVVAFFLDTLK